MLNAQVLKMLNPFQLPPGQVANESQNAQCSSAQNAQPPRASWPTSFKDLKMQCQPVLKCKSQLVKETKCDKDGQKALAQSKNIWRLVLCVRTGWQKLSEGTKRAFAEKF